MKFKSLLFAGALVVASATAGSAATYTLGDVTGGASVTKTLRVKTVDFIEFSLDAPDFLRVSALEISVTSKPGSNFSEMIAIYSGSRLVASAAATRGGGNTATLSFSGATMLPEGSYTLGIGAWKAFFPSDIAGAYSTAFFNNGAYTLRIDPTLTAVPLPAGGLLLLNGLGALAWLRRRQRKAQG